MSGNEHNEPTTDDETISPVWEGLNPDYVVEELIEAACDYYDARGRERSAAEHRLRGWVAHAGTPPL